MTTSLYVLAVCSSARLEQLELGGKPWLAVVYFQFANMTHLE
jgi:hypothetical protein